jgi:hypothetical protein
MATQAAGDKRDLPAERPKDDVPTDKDSSMVISMAGAPSAARRKTSISDRLGDFFGS